jgi:hypothetical protein
VFCALTEALEERIPVLKTGAAEVLYRAEAVKAEEAELRHNLVY